MFNMGFSTSKCETTCRLCLGRLKLQRDKRHKMVKQYRKEVAELLKNGKQEYARIRVEAVIRENFLLRAYEILELYVELLVVRNKLMSDTKEIPRDMIEAVSSIVYASHRVGDIPELSKLKVLFASKYGKEYAQEAASDATASKWQVNYNLIHCLLVEPPPPEEKLAMLSEIAQEHGVEWDLKSAARDLLPTEAASLCGPAPCAAAGSFGGAPPVPPPVPLPLPFPSFPPETPAVPGPAPAAGTALPTPPQPASPGYPSAPVFHPPMPMPMPMGMHPQVPYTQYPNAHAAAYAAAQAAAQAHAAADYAARLAGVSPDQAGPHPPFMGNRNWMAEMFAPGSPMSAHQVPPYAQAPAVPGQAGAGVRSAAPPAGGAPRGTVPIHTVHVRVPSAAADPFGRNETPDASAEARFVDVENTGNAAGVEGLDIKKTASAPSFVGGFAMKSEDEIQKAYEAAQGPPSKDVPSAPALPQTDPRAGEFGAQVITVYPFPDGMPPSDPEAGEVNGNVVVDPAVGSGNNFVSLTGFTSPYTPPPYTPPPYAGMPYTVDVTGAVPDYSAVQALPPPEILPPVASPGAAPLDEFEELTKRLEALKRQ